MSVQELSSVGQRMLVVGYLWTGARGVVSVGRCGWATTCKQIYVGGWEETGKDKVGCPISEGIFDSFRGFKFSGSTGSYSRGRREGEECWLKTRP